MLRLNARRYQHLKACQRVSSKSTGDHGEFSSQKPVKDHHRHAKTYTHPHQTDIPRSPRAEDFLGDGSESGTQPCICMDPFPEVILASGHRGRGGNDRSTFVKPATTPPDSENQWKRAGRHSERGRAQNTHRHHPNTPLDSAGYHSSEERSLSRHRVLERWGLTMSDFQSSRNQYDRQVPVETAWPKQDCASAAESPKECYAPNFGRPSSAFAFSPSTGGKASTERAQPSTTDDGSVSTKLKFLRHCIASENLSRYTRGKAINVLDTLAGSQQSADTYLTCAIKRLERDVRGLTVEMANLSRENGIRQQQLCDRLARLEWHLLRTPSHETPRSSGVNGTMETTPDPPGIPVKARAQQTSLASGYRGTASSSRRDYPPVFDREIDSTVGSTPRRTWIQDDLHRGDQNPVNVNAESTHFSTAQGQGFVDFAAEYFGKQRVAMGQGFESPQDPGSPVSSESSACSLFNERSAPGPDRQWEYLE